MRPTFAIVLNHMHAHLIIYALSRYFFCSIIIPAYSSACAYILFIPAKSQLCVYHASCDNHFSYVVTISHLLLSFLLVFVPSCTDWRKWLGPHSLHAWLYFQLAGCVGTSKEKHEGSVQQLYMIAKSGVDVMVPEIRQLSLVTRCKQCFKVAS